MRKKITSTGLAIIFFGTIAFSAMAANSNISGIQKVVDKEKNKKVKKSSKKECATEKSCCDYSKMKKSDCDKREGGEDK